MPPILCPAPARAAFAVCLLSPLVVAAGCAGEAKPAEDGVPAGMVRIELDPFVMGCSPRAGVCMPDESPAHEVHLTRPLFFDVFEVTVGDFEAALAYRPQASQGFAADQPVAGLDWHEAAAYAAARAGDAGLAACYVCEGLREEAVCAAVDDILDCPGDRLPTEAEWEGAARCGVDSAWAGGDVLADVAWTADSPPPDGTPQPGGALAANACGLYDMSGNVAEWTHSTYGAYPDGPVLDPVDGDEPALTVVRGGDHAAPASAARLAARAPTRAVAATPTVGLRLVRTAAR